jgi:hypothetical protein
MKRLAQEKRAATRNGEINWREWTRAPARPQKGCARAIYDEYGSLCYSAAVG